MRFNFAVVGLIAALLTSTPVSAHQEMSFTGQVIKLTGTAMIVRTAEGRSITVPIRPDTYVVAGLDKVSVKNIKVGQKVLVSTFSDFPDDLSDADIRILGPAAARTPGGS